MISVMSANHPGMEVSNLSEAIKTKSAEEVTKMFVESASFILRATLEKGKKGKREIGRAHV